MLSKTAETVVLALGSAPDVVLRLIIIRGRESGATVMRGAEPSFTVPVVTWRKLVRDGWLERGERVELPSVTTEDYALSDAGRVWLHAHPPAHKE